MDRLLEIAADACIGDGPLGVGHGEMIERLLDACRAIVKSVVVGEREHIEADIHEGLHRRRVAPEMEWGVLVLALGGKVVPVGDDGLDIGEGEIAVDVAGDPGERLGEARHGSAFMNALGVDRGIAGVEARVADQDDVETIRRRAGRQSHSTCPDRRRDLGSIAGRRARCCIEHGGRNEPDKSRCGQKKLEPAASHGQPVLMSGPRPPRWGRAD